MIELHRSSARDNRLADEPRHGVVGQPHRIQCDFLRGEEQHPAIGEGELVELRNDTHSFAAPLPRCYPAIKSRLGQGVAAVARQGASSASIQARLRDRGTVCHACWMFTKDEARFYRSVRRSGRSIGLTVNRIENSVESGWPDVILRGARNFHAYAELKIAKGPNALIKVRPEQINWAEEHAELNGIVHALALSERDSRFFWVIPPHRFRRAASEGCLDEECYSIRHLPQVILRWTGVDVNIQPQDPPFVEERSRLAQAKSRVSISRAALQILRRSGIRHSRNNSGSHNSESPWGDT